MKGFRGRARDDSRSSQYSRASSSRWARVGWQLDWSFENRRGETRPGRHRRWSGVRGDVAGWKRDAYKLGEAVLGVFDFSDLEIGSRSRFYRISEVFVSF